MHKKIEVLQLQYIMKIKIGGVYRHYKNGNLVKVVTLAKDSENLKDYVVYEALYSNPLSQIWIRPYYEWTEEVSNQQGEKCPRFTSVDN